MYYYTVLRSLPTIGISLFLQVGDTVGDPSRVTGPRIKAVHPPVQVTYSRPPDSNCAQPQKPSPLPFPQSRCPPTLDWPIGRVSVSSFAHRLFKEKARGPRSYRRRIFTLHTFPDTIQSSPVVATKNPNPSHQGKLVWPRRPLTDFLCSS